MSSQLRTGWICIASSGRMLNGKTISVELLNTISDRYNDEYYTAMIWPDGDRSVAPLGSVRELKTESSDGVTKLFAVLEPTTDFIEANMAGQYLFCTIDVRNNFASTGKPYLSGVSATDSPMMTHITPIKFCLDDKRIHPQLTALTDYAQQFSVKNIISGLTRFTTQETTMDLQAILDSFTFSATQSASLSTRSIYLDGTPMMSSIMQASPLLSRLTFRTMRDPHAPTQDPIKQGLRTGRREHERHIVRADPSSQSHEYAELDSSAVFTRVELATILGGLDQKAAGELLESMALALFADDVLRIGFNGTRAEKTTNPETCPNGEDVAVGWHALAKKSDPLGKRILTDAVVFDPDGQGDYEDLDSMVYRLLDALPKHWRQDPRLQVLVGGDLLQRHKKAHLKPGLVRSKDQQLKIADMPVNTHQHIPGSLLAVTFLSNLQVLGLENCERLAAGDLNDDASWGIRFFRPQAYALGTADAYAAFDAITIQPE